VQRAEKEKERTSATFPFGERKKRKSSVWGRCTPQKGVVVLTYSMSRPLFFSGGCPRIPPHKPSMRVEKKTWGACMIAMTFFCIVVILLFVLFWFCMFVHVGLVVTWCGGSLLRSACGVPVRATLTHTAFCCTNNTDRSYIFSLLETTPKSEEPTRICFALIRARTRETFAQARMSKRQSHRDTLRTPLNDGASTNPLNTTPPN